MDVCKGNIWKTICLGQPSVYQMFQKHTINQGCSWPPAVLHMYNSLLFLSFFIIELSHSLNGLVSSWSSHGEVHIILTVPIQSFIPGNSFPYVPTGPINHCLLMVIFVLCQWILLLWLAIKTTPNIPPSWSQCYQWFITRYAFTLTKAFLFFIVYFDSASPTFSRVILVSRGKFFSKDKIPSSHLGINPKPHEQQIQSLHHDRTMWETRRLFLTFNNICLKKKIKTTKQIVN